MFSKTLQISEFGGEQTEVGDGEIEDQKRSPQVSSDAVRVNDTPPMTNNATNSAQHGENHGDISSQEVYT